MRSLMEKYLSCLGWEAWLLVCAVVVVLWAAAIAGATALFQGSGRARGARRTHVEQTGVKKIL
jgi:hypothetical protein